MVAFFGDCALSVLVSKCCKLAKNGTILNVWRVSHTSADVFQDNSPQTERESASQSKVIIPDLGILVG